MNPKTTRPSQLCFANRLQDMPSTLGQPAVAVPARISCNVRSDYPFLSAAARRAEIRHLNGARQPLSPNHPHGTDWQQETRPHSVIVIL
jgi:hypothetical protein